MTAKNYSATLTILTLAGLTFAATLLPLRVGAQGKGGVSSPPDFNRDVRPILAQACLKCHGMDDAQRQAGLRLDIREGALKKLASGSRAVVPGKPSASELVRRIESKNADEQMPPPSTNKFLTAEQKRTLRAWVSGGAKYEPHWAFVAPRQAALPKVSDKSLTSWPRNAIDYFTLARMTAAGLKPSPAADRYTLIRREYLDLTGIPPTPEQADTFVADTRPDAYERVVDSLLASPHYGERWARRWLDLARYADTNGYEKDRPRSIWPYRDWVISAFNADMPYDQFTIDQLAGDLLPHATLADRVATGFHRNTMRNEEGGIDPQEYRYLAVVDRVATTGTTWLGLTTGCAQCHTHKYDPITHTDYFRLFAFLNNADEPEMATPTPMQAANRVAVEAEARAREARLGDAFPAGDGLTGAQNRAAKYAAWEQTQAATAVRWQIAHPLSAHANLPTLTVQPDDSVLASGDQSKKDDYDLTFAAPPAPAGGAPITAIRLEALPDDRLPHGGPGRVDYEGPFGDFFLSEFSAKVGDAPAVKWARTSQSTGGDAHAAIDGDPLTGWNIDGHQGQTAIAVFTPAAPITLTPGATLALRLHFERYYAAGLGRFRISFTTDTRPAVAGLPADIEADLTVAAPDRTSAQSARLLAYFLSIAPELAKERTAIAKIRAQSPAYPTTLVLAERAPTQTRPTFLHHRGEYLSPTVAVTPGVPSFLPPLPSSEKPDRLLFARWVASPQNPLTARVAVNRQWDAFFGSGIVTTVGDFGYQGAPPTNPELLDYLAIQFVKDGWSFKKLDRLIVLSATYRQSAIVPDESAKLDPSNRWLSHLPRVRLDAEEIRDAALSEAGLLSPKIGGPSVFPPQPPGVTTDGTYGGMPWNVSPGEDRYRRGLYTFSKRSAPYAMLAAFDAPTGELCVARREVSDTPLQALTLLNDAVFTDAAQALGKSVAARPGTDRDRVVYLFRRCATRPPTEREVGMMERFLEMQGERVAEGAPHPLPLSPRSLVPRSLLGRGKSIELVSSSKAGKEELQAPLSPEVSEVRANAGRGAGGEGLSQNAYTALARAILNLDEVVTRQ